MKRGRFSVDETLRGISGRISKAISNEEKDSGLEELVHCLEEILPLLVDELQSGDDANLKTVCRFVQGLLNKSPPAYRWGSIVVNMSAVFLAGGRRSFAEPLSGLFNIYFAKWSLSPEQSPLAPILHYAMCAANPSQPHDSLQVADVVFSVEGHYGKAHSNGDELSSFPLPLARNSSAFVSSCRLLAESLVRTNVLTLCSTDWSALCGLAEIGCEVDVSSKWAASIKSVLDASPPGSHFAAIAKLGVSQCSTCGDWRAAINQLCAMEGGEWAVADALQFASGPSIRTLLRRSSKLILTWIEKYPHVCRRLREYILSPLGVAFLLSSPEGFSTTAQYLFPDRSCLQPLWDVIAHSHDGWRCVPALIELWSPVPPSIAQLPCREFIRCPSLNAAAVVYTSLMANMDAVRDVFTQCLQFTTPHHIGFIRAAIPHLSPESLSAILQQAAPVYPKETLRFIAEVSSQLVIAWCGPVALYHIVEALDGNDCYDEGLEISLCTGLSRKVAQYWDSVVPIEGTWRRWRATEAIMRCLSRSKTYSRVSEVASTFDGNAFPLAISCVVAYSIESGTPIHIDIPIPVESVPILSEELRLRYLDSRSEVAASVLGPTIVDLAHNGGLLASIELALSVRWEAQQYVSQTKIQATPAALNTIRVGWGLTPLLTELVFCVEAIEAILDGMVVPECLSTVSVLCAAMPIAVRRARLKKSITVFDKVAAAARTQTRMISTFFRDKKTSEQHEYYLLYSALMAGLPLDELTVYAQFMSSMEEAPSKWMRLMDKPNRDVYLPRVQPMLCRLTDKCIHAITGSSSSANVHRYLRALVTLITLIEEDCDLIASNVINSLLDSTTSRSSSQEVVSAIINNASQEYLNKTVASLAVTLINVPNSGLLLDRLQERTKLKLFWPVLRFLTGPSRLREDWDPVLEAAVDLITSLSGDRRVTALTLLKGAMLSLSPQDRLRVLQSASLVDLCSALVTCCDVEEQGVPATALLGYFGAGLEGAVKSSIFNEKFGIQWGPFVQEALSVYCFDALETIYPRAAFTIQQLLRIAGAEEQRCEVGKAELSNLSGEWWTSLGERKQKIFALFQSSSFKRPDPPSEVVGGHVLQPDMSCTAWQSVWVKRLIHRSSGVFKSLFDVFRPVAVRIEALSFLLKSCLIHLITTSTDSHREIVEEIHWVCDTSLDDNVHQTLADIFICLRGAEETSRRKESSREERAMLQTITSFWELVDRSRLVNASIRCGAHTRALYYTEGARVLPSGPVLGSIVPSLRVMGEHSAAKSLDTQQQVSDGPLFCHTDAERENELALSEQLMIAGVSGGVSRYVGALTGLGQYSAAVWAARAHPDSSGVVEGVQEAAWKLSEWDVVGPIPQAGYSNPLRALNQTPENVSALIDREYEKLAKEVAITVKEVGQLSAHQLSLAAGLQDILFCNTTNHQTVAVQSYLQIRVAQEARGPDLWSLRSHLCRMAGVQLGSGAAIEESSELSNAGRYKAAIAVLKRHELEFKVNVDEKVADVLWSAGRKLEAVQLLSEASRSTTLIPEVRGRLLARSAERGCDLQTRSLQESQALFDEAISLSPKCQDTLNAHGMFHYTLFTGMRDDLTEAANRGEKMSGTTECIRHAVLGMKSLGTSLSLGSKHLILALPRLLTMWLDSTALLDQRGHTASLAQDVNGAAKQVVDKCAAPLFALCLPQLLSRLGHTNLDVLDLISQIVLNLMRMYPQQTLWQVLPIQCSATSTKRADFVKKKIIMPFAHSAADKLLTTNMKVLFETFTAVCMSGAGIANENLTHLPMMKKFLNLLSSAKFIMPRVTSLYPSLNTTNTGSSVIFQQTRVFIASLADKVFVMSSLMKPKRIRIYDSAGSNNYYLMKSKDEPRKDIRMMEIAMIVNHLFQKGGGSVRGTDRCSLKRYAVLALSDDCAAIEWVPETVTLRKLAEDCYALDGTGVSLNTVKGLLDKVKDGRMTKMDMFDKHIFPAAPPVLHQWLIRTFPTPHLWYQARIRFTQSCALWSMCGHVVGLGDRHGENLLLCSDTGEIMHVDFAVMFDRGEVLEVPERVRFRLTPNLIDAMGVAGPYGEFQAVSEASLSTLCTSKDVVSGILDTFTHDPLIEWSKRGGTDVRHLMKRCSRRLDGYLDLYGLPKDHTALSYSGQVARLISHSSNKSVLSEMYIWWMAWM